MKKEKKYTHLLFSFVILVIAFFSGGPALAIDDGARAYWKGRDGTQGVSYQHLRLDADNSNSEQFDPVQHIYPNAGIEANLSILTWAHHLTLFNRASFFSFNLIGGNVDADINVNATPAAFLPPETDASSSLTQSSSGFADPSAQFVVNLFGTSQLKGTDDLLNYEPKWTLDIAGMLALPAGEYDNKKLVNLGLNRWYGRVAVPFKYHFGPFTRGYMTSLEFIPSIWLFDKNDDFVVGHKLENDPLLQLEGHLTHDFTPTFFASLDLLYRGGFQSEIDGTEAGDELDIGTIGFTLSCQVTDNITLRTGYSSNVFGSDDLDTSLIRLQLIYAWHKISENEKKLRR